MRRRLVPIIGLGVVCGFALTSAGTSARKLVTCDGRSATIVVTGPGYVVGTAGPDVIAPDHDFGLMHVDGAGGNDVICGVDASFYEDWLVGGAGNDTIFGLGGDDLLIGDNDYSGCGLNTDEAPGDGDDHLDGGADNDRICAQGGDDELRGKGGLDELFGGSDADTLNGGPDRDSLFGEGGKDELRGAGGPDDIFGGAKADTLYGGPDNDYLDGEGGGDTCVGGSGSDTLVSC
jgi:Ca2+-binding RTX toxin-like protein